MAEPGIALVPARLLGDTVKSLSAAPVDFETDESQAHIRCAAYEGTLRLLPAEDFPGLQEPAGTQITAEAGAFAEAVARWPVPPRATRPAPCSPACWSRSAAKASSWSPPTPTGWRFATSSPRPTARARRSSPSAR